MQITVGYDYFSTKKNPTNPTPIIWDTTKIVNPHLLLLGGSGMGKSHLLRNLATQIALAQSPILPTRLHIFDVHGDLDFPDHLCSTLSFGENAPFGLTPLHVNPDPEFGGVRKCIQNFIQTIDQSSRTPLGLKQEKVLRSLLEDLLLDFGFDPSNPSSWNPNSLQSSLISSGRDNRLYITVPLEDKDKAKALGARWDPDQKSWWISPHLYINDITQWKPAFKPRSYPSVNDLNNYAKRIYRERFLGSDQHAIHALINFNKKTQAHQRKLLDYLQQHHQQLTPTPSVVSPNGADRLSVVSPTGHNSAAQLRGTDTEPLDKAKEAALNSYEAYLDSCRTGHELDTLLKYQSPEILASVSDRISNLFATGLFKQDSYLSHFNPSKPIWRYKLNTLSYSEKKMFVLFALQHQFALSVQSGIATNTAHVHNIVILDELGTYTSSHDEKGDGIIGVITREARKYGLALWGAHQDLDGVPTPLITSSGTKIIIGLDETTWPSITTKMALDRKILEWLTPQHSITVQFKEKAAQKNTWKWTLLPASTPHTPTYTPR